MIDSNHLCPNCMQVNTQGADVCPHCGYKKEEAARNSRALSVFSILGGRYLLGEQIGSGGFGITYIAMDLVEEKRVAIKEFFPQSLASREGDDVAALPGEDGRAFQEALRSFRKEADLLSRFAGRNGVVTYRGFIQENGTSYLVMDYVEGINLKKQMRQTGETFSQERALELLHPILLAVDAMHKKNVLHRDISPENLILKPDGTLTLIDFDFGAAREYDLEEEENLTVILKHGYAPEEQYHAGSRQGPWTDVYACCAVLYQMVSGILPQDAAHRDVKDQVLPLDEIEGIEVDESFARAIETGMNISASERYPSVQALLAALYPGGTVHAAADVPFSEPAAQPDTPGPEVSAARLEHAAESAPEQPKSDAPVKNKGRRWAVIGGAVLGMLALCGALKFIVFRGSSSPTVTPLIDGGMENGTVWLLTDEVRDDEDTDYYYQYSYNEYGCYDEIVSCNVSPHGYITFGGSMGISDYGEITSQFYYDYDDAGRIVTARQFTGEDEFYCDYTYFDDTDMISRIDQGRSDDDSFSFIEFDTSGHFVHTEGLEDGMRMTTDYEYLDSVTISITDRVYSLDTDDNSIKNLITDYADGYELFGVEYELSENGEVLSYELTGDPSEIYGEVTHTTRDEDRFLDRTAVHRTESPVWPWQARTYLFAEDKSVAEDEYGNILSCTQEDGHTDYYRYAEYEVVDGVYTPTGRISEPTDVDMDERMREIEAGLEASTIEESDFSENSTAEASEFSWEGIGYLGKIGYLEGKDYPENLMTFYKNGCAAGVFDPCPIYDDYSAYNLLASGEIDFLLVKANAEQVLPDVEVLPDGFDLNEYPDFCFVLPAVDWYTDDGKTFYTLMGRDMDICAALSFELGVDGNYDGSVWSALLPYALMSTDSKYLFTVPESEHVKIRIFTQYLNSKARVSQISWELRAKEDGHIIASSKE